MVGILSIGGGNYGGSPYTLQIAPGLSYIFLACVGSDLWCPEHVVMLCIRVGFGARGEIGDSGKLG